MAGSTSKVEICGVDTSTLPVLSQERMRELLVQAQDGDQQAMHELVQGNLRLVLSVIKRFHNRGQSVDDLFQVGCIGLMKGIKNFDITMGVRLSTYCVPMIIGEIRRFLRDYNSVRVSRSLRDTAYKALRVREEMTAAAGKEPPIQEIAKAMQMDEADVVYALEAIQDSVSLFETVYQDAGDAIYIVDQIRDTKVDENDWIRDLSIKQALAKLNPRERSIITERFFEGKTQMEVAGEIGISQAQVSRLEKAALQQMRKYV